MSKLFAVYVTYSVQDLEEDISIVIRVPQCLTCIDTDQCVMKVGIKLLYIQTVKTCSGNLTMEEYSFVH